MAQLGKQWEAKVKQGLKESFPDGFIYRLPDQITGNKFTSQNPCDFFTFAQGKFFLIECKQHKGASIPFTAIPQYERLLQYKDKPNVYAGVIIWFSQHDKVFWCDIKQLQKMVADGRKSVRIKIIQEGLYNILQVPGTKLRVFIRPNMRSILQFYEEAK